MPYQPDDPLDRSRPPWAEEYEDGLEAGEEVGIPKKHRIKRRYTMTDRALAQRREAAQAPKPGMAGKRNHWKHGQYAKTMLTRIKPCLSTCPHYPCHLVEEGATEPGGDCLDAGELLNIIRSVHRVLENPEESQDFLEVSAVNIGNSIRILEMLQEDILRDGTVVKSQKYDKKGNVYQEEVKLHPSLYALPKLIADLGMTPEQFMITPKAQSKNKNEEDAVKSIADLMKSAGEQMAAAREKKHKNGSDPAK